MDNTLCVKIGKLKLKNPVMVASGTFGYAEEFKDFINLRELGAIVTKTITLNPRAGNPPPRTCETPMGMLNSIGLENPGIKAFIRDKLPFLKKIGAPLIVSIASEAGREEFIELVRHLDKIKEVRALELNISCPNIKHSKLLAPKASLISQDPQATYEVVSSVRKNTAKTLITKLSPNVTEISQIAKAAEKAGSDAVSLINTLTAMSIDVKNRKPKIASIVGGLSGPAVKPVALRMVWEVFKEVKIPIIGMGGIIDTSDALEFFIAGASAIGIGTANFINPRAATEIIKGLKSYIVENEIGNITKLTGSIRA